MKTYIKIVTAKGFFDENPRKLLLSRDDMTRVTCLTNTGAAYHMIYPYTNVVCYYLTQYSIRITKIC